MDVYAVMIPQRAFEPGAQVNYKDTVLHISRWRAKNVGNAERNWRLRII